MAIEHKGVGSTVFLTAPGAAWGGATFLFQALRKQDLGCVPSLWTPQECNRGNVCAPTLRWAL